MKQHKEEHSGAGQVGGKGSSGRGRWSRYFGVARRDENFTVQHIVSRIWKISLARLTKSAVTEGRRAVPLGRVSGGLGVAPVVECGNQAFSWIANGGNWLQCVLYLLLFLYIFSFYFFFFLWHFHSHPQLVPFRSV